MTLVAWAGPVGGRELDSVTWGEPSRILAVSMGLGSKYACTPPMAGWSTAEHVDCHGSEAFRRLYAQINAERGPLETAGEAMFRRAGIDSHATHMSRRVLAGFSAAHGLIEPILLAESAGSFWDGVHLADAYYTGQPSIKPGMLAFAKRAAAGDRIMTATVSGFAGKGTEPSNACIQPLIAAVGAQPIKVSIPGPVQPIRAWAKGKFLVADFGTSASHAEHATKLAPIAMQAWTAPAVGQSTLLGGFDSSAPAPWEPARATFIEKWGGWLAVGSLGLLFAIGAVIVHVGRVQDRGY